MKRALFFCAALGLALLPACHPSAGAGAAGIPLPALTQVDPDIAEAITAARAAVEQAPGSGVAWGALGDRYSVHDFKSEAAACYVQAERLDPEHPVWTYRLARSLMHDHPEQAAPVFERSLRSLVNYAPAHEAYADMLVLLGRTDEAIEHFVRAGQLDAKAPQAETGLGRIYLARGDFDAALTHLLRALERDAKHTEAHTALAQVYHALGREEEARQHAELSRTLPRARTRYDPLANPNLPPAGARARASAAKRLEKQGQLAEAEENYRIALRCNPDGYQARLNLAELLVRQGRREEALELLREAQEKNPSFEQVRQDLARLSRAKESE